MPKIQAASRTLLTHLRFDAGEAGRCCLHFHILHLRNKTPAAFQESPRIHGWEGSCSSDQQELLTLRQIQPEFPLSAALHNHSHYSSARGPQQGECCTNRATDSPSPVGIDLSRQESWQRGRAGTQKTEWLSEIWAVGGEREKDEASSQQPFQEK